MITLFIHVWILHYTPFGFCLGRWIGFFIFPDSLVWFVSRSWIKSEFTSLPFCCEYIRYKATPFCAADEQINTNKGFAAIPSPTRLSSIEPLPAFSIAESAVKLRSGKAMDNANSTGGRSRRNSPSTSASSTYGGRSTNGERKCHCGEIPILLTARTESNFGKQFYTCRKRRVSRKNELGLFDLWLTNIIKRRNCIALHYRENNKRHRKTTTITRSTLSHLLIHYSPD